jgi:hypothetical protein
MKIHIPAQALKPWLFFAACAGLTLFISLNAWRHLDDRAIYPGWLVQDYIAYETKGENMALDFKKNAASKIYEHCLVMWPGLFLYEKFGLAPEKYNRAHVFLQTALLIGGLAFLIATFTKSWWMNWLALLLTLGTPYALKNLGFFYGSISFLETLSLPMYYAPAHAMIFMALACFFRERLLGMFIFIGLTVWCHVVMGFMLAVFIGAYFLVRPRAAFRPAFLAGLLICAALSLSVGGSTLGLAAGDSAGIPMEEWLKQVRMFGTHWFLSSRPQAALGQLSTMLGLTFIFFALLPRLSLERPLREKLMAGAAGIWVFTLVGLVFVEIVPVQMVIRLCPQRSLFLVSILTVPLAACWLLSLVSESEAWPRRLAAAALFGLVMIFWTYQRSFSLWLMVMPLLAGLVWPRLEPWPAMGRRFRFLAGEPAPAGRLYKLLALGLVAALTIGGVGLAVRNIYRLYNVYLTPWAKENPAKLSGFREVQLWAEAHSPGQALFMADPANYYSWSAYSRRSHFGNVQDWGFRHLVFISDAAGWLEGRRRLREFGLDLDRIRPEEVGPGLSDPYFAQFLPLVSSLYYALPPERFEYFRRVYQVDYAIMEKAKVKEARGQLLRQRFPVVFENDYYYVLRLGPGAPDPIAGGR